MQTRKLAAIMFTDIVGYTSLMAKSEQQALELILKNLDIQKQAATEPNEPRILYNAMCVYSRLGVIEKALDLLESRLKTTSINRAWIEHDSDLDNIRDHPRFKNALGKLK